MLGDNWFQWLKIAAAIGCGLVAGVFFAFSTFVMAALARLHPAQGIAAMQSINITVINPLFMLAFMGTAGGCAALAVSALVKWQQPGAVYLLAGGALYFVGTFLVTMVFNVPLNDALAAADPRSAQGEQLWKTYLATWTLWNHVRTLAALAASAALTLALLVRGGAS
jgi:uncharacterized membrane protein